MSGLSRPFTAFLPLFISLSPFFGPVEAANAPSGLSAPTVEQLRAAFPGRPMRQVDGASFRQYVALHAFEGQLLTGSALAATVAPAADQAPDSLPPACRTLPPERRVACADSISELVRNNLIRHGSKRDTREAGDQPDHMETQERTRRYAGNFFLDMNGNWDMGGKEWAAVLYVVVGVVVVGAFIVYGAQATYELITNDEDDPIFREIGLRYSYSGRQWSDGGPALYRNANLIGLRFGIGLDRAGMGLGVAVEGGYIDLSLRGIEDPAKAFDFQGGYLVAGPMVRFGHNDPLSLTLEFLNGTSDHASIGWISKSRMSLQTRVGNSGWLMGAHLGAVFYDLSFYDGLGQREGNFNRDLSLVIGADTGWEF